MAVVKADAGVVVLKEVIGEDERAEVEEAVASCPVSALSIIDDD
jgi:ferredoxin